MKIWYGFNSEHSANLVMIGTFKEVSTAREAKDAMDKLVRHVVKSNDQDYLSERFSDDLRQLLRDLNLYSIGPSELEQFRYDVSFKQEGKKLVLKTDEVDVSAFFKLMLDRGARIEIFSAHEDAESAVATEE